MISKLKLLWLIIPLILVALWLSKRDETELDVPQYRFGQISSGSIETHVLTTGTLSPLVMVQVGSQVSGTIQSLKADFNKQVLKGDVIAQIEPSLFQARVAQGRAALQSAKATLDKSKISLNEAQRQLERTRRLRKQNMVSESEMDDAEFAYAQAEVEYQVQQGKAAEAQATLQLAQVNLAYTTIYAPIDGVVISRDVDVGQTVAASLQAPTLFTIAQDLTRMQIEAYVDEAYIGMVHETQPVNFTVYAYPDRSYSGEVTQVRLNPDSTSDVVRYKCIIEVDNKDLSLKPGMTATVNISTAKKSDIFKVPNAALRYVPDMMPDELNRLRSELQLKPGEGAIWMLKNNAPVVIRVETGLSSKDETEISGAQINKGMTVILGENKKKKPSKRNMGLNLF